MITGLPFRYVTAYEISCLDRETGEWAVEDSVPCELDIETVEHRFLWVFPIREKVVRNYRESVLAARRTAWNKVPRRCQCRIDEVRQSQDDYTYRATVWIDGHWLTEP